MLPGLLIAAFAPTGPVVLGIDDTIERRREANTFGCNAVLRSLRFGPGDEILALAHVYGPVRDTIGFVAGRTGAHLVEAGVPFPRPDADRFLICGEPLLGGTSRSTACLSPLSPSQPGQLHNPLDVRTG